MKKRVHALRDTMLTVHEAIKAQELHAVNRYGVGVISARTEGRSGKKAGHEKRVTERG